VGMEKKLLKDTNNQFFFISRGRYCRADTQTKQELKTFQILKPHTTTKK
jgi:hypothetical protein